MTTDQTPAKDLAKDQAQDQARNQAKTQTRSKPNLSFGEFIVLMAFLMSLVALSTDAILPAFDSIGTEFGRTDPQSLQLLVTILFGGLALGQLVYGPLSDHIGRKPAIYIGLGLFFLGSLLSSMADSFAMLLAGRFLQGVGVASPRTVMIALVRDLYAGRAMARIMSVIMGVFIFVPTLAPILGQSVYLLAGWRAIFILFMLLGGVSGLWLALRQGETLLVQNRRRLTSASIRSGLGIILRTPSCTGYMVMAGIVMAPFMCYLSTAQHLFQKTYQVGEAFPFFFAGLALSIGLASFANSWLVMRVGMRKLVRVSLIVMVCLASLALLLSSFWDFIPPLPLFLALFAPLFFSMGLLFGNINAMAMEEVGKVAGLASAFIGSLSTVIAMVIATLLGHLYDGSILALGAGFVVCSSLGYLLLRLTEAKRERNEQARWALEEEAANVVKPDQDPKA